jgi:DNA-binding Lrp family transcriptional regulator
MQMSDTYPPLDELDQTIVATLRTDGRMTIPALAERVGISRATAYARFDRLRGRGVITGFRATVDHEAMGMGVSALVLGSADQTMWPDMPQQLAGTYGVEWVGLCAGQFDFAILVRARDLNELRDVVLDGLLKVPGIKNVQTSVLLDEMGEL